MRLNEPKFATPDVYNYTAFQQHREMCENTGFPLEYDWFDYLTRIVGISLAWILCLQIIIFKLLACLRLDFEDQLNGIKIDVTQSKSKSLDASKEAVDQICKSNELLPDKLSYQPIVKRWKQQHHTDVTQKTGSAGSLKKDGISMDATSIEYTSTTQTSTNNSQRRIAKASKEMIKTPQKAKRGSHECVTTQKSSNRKPGSAEHIPMFGKTNKGSPEHNNIGGNKKHTMRGSREAITQESPRNKRGSQESLTPVSKPKKGSRETTSQESNNKKKGASPHPPLARTQSVGNTTDGEKSVKLPRAKKGFHDKELQVMEDLFSLEEKSKLQKVKEAKK